MVEDRHAHRRRLAEVVSKIKIVIDKLSPHGTLIIAVLSLFLSIWTAYGTRLHDQLSLRPGVSYLWHTSEDDPEVGLFIENTGSGPARIDETKIYLDTKPIDRIWQVTDMTTSLYKDGKPAAWGQYKQGYILGNGQTIPIYHAKSQDVENWDGLVNLLRGSTRPPRPARLFVISKVCSMYDECFYVCSNVEDKDCRIAEDYMKKN
jgi:hypothetical protein